MAAQTPDQRGQPRRQFFPTPFPGAPRGKTPVLRQQWPNLLHNWLSLFQKAEPSIGCGESPKDHDDQGFDKELVGGGLLPSALAFGWRRWRWYLLDEPEAADKDAALG